MNQPQSINELWKTNNVLGNYDGKYHGETLIFTKFKLRTP